MHKIAVNQKYQTIDLPINTVNIHKKTTQYITKTTYNTFVIKGR